MPRIHYPKGRGTSRVRGAVTGRRCRVPRRVSPFITKAHETLTRRPGESVVSVSRVRRRPGRHSPNRPRRGGSHRTGDFPGRVTPPGSPVAIAISKGSVGGDLPEEAFQRGAPCRAASPRVPGPVDCVTNRVSGCPPVPVPLALLGACFSANLGAFNPRSYTLTDDGDSFGGPPLTTSRGLRGTHKAFPDAGGDDWRNPVIRAVRAL